MTDDQPGLAPLWFEYLVVIVCAGVVSFGGFALLLAVLGHYSAAPALLLGATGTVAGTFLGRPRRDEWGRSTRAGTLPAAGMCVVAVATAVWNAIDISHHVAVDRDPGVYAVAGRWIAEHGNLVVPAGAPWTSKGTGFNWASAGMYPQPNGTLEFQFAHLLPSLLAQAQDIGGDALMFRVPALLGALALCTVYAVGCRTIRRPWLVLAAVTALAVGLPELSVTRDTYSEAATQVLVWGGIALLLRGYRKRGVGVSLLAGLAIGGTLMTRIDAVVYLLPLPLLAAVSWLAAASRSDRRSLLRVYAAVLLGALPPAILGTLDVQRRGGNYYHDLHRQVWTLYAALALSTVVALALVGLWPRLAGLRTRLTARRRQLSVAAVWIIAVGLVVAWSLRPAGPKAHRPALVGSPLGLEKAEALPIAPNRSFGEQSMRWIAWYIGPIALALAIAGLCVLTVRAIRRGSSAAIVVLAMTGVITAGYLWEPNITPEQVWAMRRYVPASLPLLVLAAAVAVDAAATVCAARLRERAWQRRTVVAGAVALVAFPLGATLPVRHFQWQAGYLPLVTRTCDTVGPNAAVLFPAGDHDRVVLMQTLRSWCDVPVSALGTAPTTQDLRAVAAEFRADDMTLWVLGSSAASIRGADPALAPTLIGTAVSSRELEKTLSRPPQNYTTAALTVYAAKVPAA